MSQQVYNLNDLRPLTALQFDECKDKALRRVQRNIGDKPTRAQFQRELGRLWTVLDLIALVVFIPALFVSSVHIITHMGKLAAASYDAATVATAGTVISRDWYVVIHQWASIPLAEGAMILFMVLFGLTRQGWRRWVYLALAAVALVFVGVANWQSGIGLLESILPPIFTIGIGLKLEHLIVESLARRAQVDRDYLTALGIWEAANADATKHPDYKPMLANELWQQLMKPKGNQQFIDAPSGFKVAAVQRELMRERWAYDEPAPVAEYVADPQPAAAPVAANDEPAPVAEYVADPQPAAAPVAANDTPFGSTAPAGVEPESMVMTLNGNGHGITATNPN